MNTERDSDSEYLGEGIMTVILLGRGDSDSDNTWER